MDIISHTSEGFKAHKPASPTAGCGVTCSWGADPSSPTTLRSRRCASGAPLVTEVGVGMRVLLLTGGSLLPFPLRNRNLFPACPPSAVRFLASLAGNALRPARPFSLHPAPPLFGRGVQERSAHRPPHSSTALSAPTEVLEPSVRPGLGVPPSCNAAGMGGDLSAGQRGCGAHHLPGAGPRLAALWPRDSPAGRSHFLLIQFFIHKMAKKWPLLSKSAV